MANQKSDKKVVWNQEKPKKENIEGIKICQDRGTNSDESKETRRKEKVC